MTVRHAIFSLAICIGSLACGFLPVHAASSSIFTEDQAKQGEALYSAKQCASCHGADLNGLGQAPPLNGTEFLPKYQEQPMSMLFVKIHTTMPASAPGSLSPKETAEIIAYLLKQNSYASGNVEFPSNDDGLKAPLPKQ
jgi:mono/diheme cytochrome c family protein